MTKEDNPTQLKKVTGDHPKLVAELKDAYFKWVESEILEDGLWKLNRSFGSFNSFFGVSYKNGIIIYDNWAT